MNSLLILPSFLYSDGIKESEVKENGIENDKELEDEIDEKKEAHVESADSDDEVESKGDLESIEALESEDDNIETPKEQLCKSSEEEKQQIIIFAFNSLGKISSFSSLPHYHFEKKNTKHIHSFFFNKEKHRRIVGVFLKSVSLQLLLFFLGVGAKINSTLTINVHFK